jgi:hypothetical protein
MPYSSSCVRSRETSHEVLIRRKGTRRHQPMAYFKCEVRAKEGDCTNVSHTTVLLWEASRKTLGHSHTSTSGPPNARPVDIFYMLKVLHGVVLNSRTRQFPGARMREISQDLGGFAKPPFDKTGASTGLLTTFRTSSWQFRCRVPSKCYSTCTGTCTI